MKRNRVTGTALLPQTSSLITSGESAVSDEQLLAPVYARGDGWMRIFIVGHTLLALVLAGINDTWIVTACVAPLVFAAFMICIRLAPGSFLMRCMAGLALQTMVSLHV